MNAEDSGKELAVPSPTAERRVPAPAEAPARDPWMGAALLLGAGALYLFRLGWVGLYDLDEAVYAEISREMVALKDWVTPHLDGIAYLEKPPLLDWLNALAFRLFSPSAFSARLATALAAVAAV